jgi:ribonuclease P protein component
MSLGNKYIIPSKPNFTEVLKNPDLFEKVDNFFLYGKANNELNPRLGVAIKKKDYKLATERNYLKRKVKSSFRAVVAELPCLDFVVVVKKNKPLRDEYLNLSLLWKKCF